MKRLIILLLMLFSSVLFAQNTLILFKFRGTVNDEAGNPVLGAIIRLDYVAHGVNELGEPSTIRESLTVMTDELGRYMIELNLAADWDGYRLSVDEESIDRFKYNPPQNKHITDIITNSIISGNFELIFNWQLNVRELYESELEEINKYGSDSDKARVIRLRGIPEKITRFSQSEGKSGEIWYYYSDGIAIRFVNGARDKDFYFKPVNDGSK